MKNGKNLKINKQISTPWVPEQNVKFFVCHFNVHQRTSSTEESKATKWFYIAIKIT